MFGDRSTVGRTDEFRYLSLPRGPVKDGLQESLKQFVEHDSCP